MRKIGLEGLAPGPNTSRKHPQHKIYPYLLKDLEVRYPNHVWSTDITYIPMRLGFMYLMAILDWYSRYVVAWGLSNTLDTQFCLESLDEALKHGQPEIFNTDQGARFTSDAFTGKLKAKEIKISMDGRVRAFDNIFVERLWRTVKYEDIYLKEYATVIELGQGLNRYFRFYNEEHPHQALKSRSGSGISRPRTKMRSGLDNRVHHSFFWKASGCDSQQTFVKIPIHSGSEV